MIANSEAKVRAHWLVRLEMTFHSRVTVGNSSDGSAFRVRQHRPTRLHWDLAAGKHDDWSSRSDTPYCGSEMVPIHIRHVVINKHRVKTVHRHKSQSFLCGRCCNHDKSRPFKWRSSACQNPMILIDAEKHWLWSLIHTSHGTSRVWTARTIEGESDRRISGRTARSSSDSKTQ
jgi:hypothetical protein